MEPSSGVVVSNSTPPTDATTTAVDSEAAAVEGDDDDDDDDELEKWQAMYGPSRVLYTIKEEEREGIDYSAENSADRSEATSHEKRDINLRDCFSGPVKMVDDDFAVDVDVEEATPYSTPCASPPYFTPSPSPGHDVRILLTSPVNGDVSSPGSDVFDREESRVGLVSLRIEG